MLLTPPLLDPLGAIGEAEAMLASGKLLFLVVVPIGLLVYLWSLHIRKKFSREPQQVKPAKEVRGADVFLWMMVAVMVISFVALAGWS
jgi:hypothetical protein